MLTNMACQQHTFTPRQKEILAEALRILAEEGSKALTMKRVARGVGFTEAAMYRHFENKRAMLFALYAFVRQNLLATLSPVLALDCPPPQRLEAFVEKAIDFLLANKGVNLILLAESIQHDDPELRKAMLAIFMGFKALVETLLQAGITSGHFRKDMDTDICATCLAGMIQGSLTRHVLGSRGPETFDLAGATTSIVQCFLTGVLLPRIG